MEKQLNIIKLIKNVRDQKVLSKNSLMSEQLKQQLKHSEKNLIDLEDTSDFDSGSNVESSDDIEIDGKIIKHATLGAPGEKMNQLVHPMDRKVTAL